MSERRHGEALLKLAAEYPEIVGAILDRVAGHLQPLLPRRGEVGVYVFQHWNQRFHRWGGRRAGLTNTDYHRTGFGKTDRDALLSLLKMVREDFPEQAA